MFVIGTISKEAQHSRVNSHIVCNQMPIAKGFTKLRLISKFATILFEVKFHLEYHWNFIVLLVCHCWNGSEISIVEFILKLLVWTVCVKISGVKKYLTAVHHVVNSTRHVLYRAVLLVDWSLIQILANVNIEDKPLAELISAVKPLLDN